MKRNMLAWIMILLLMATPCAAWAEATEWNFVTPVEEAPAEEAPAAESAVENAPSVETDFREWLRNTVDEILKAGRVAVEEELIPWLEMRISEAMEGSEQLKLWAGQRWEEVQAQAESAWDQAGAYAEAVAGDVDVYVDELNEYVAGEVARMQEAVDQWIAGLG